MKENNDFLWNQFIKLGEMIGDGLHYEEPWISKEYRKLAKILLPPTEEEKQWKKERLEKLDSQVKERLQKDNCAKCGSKLKQTRKGSKTVICTNEECKARYIYKTKKK